MSICIDSYIEGNRTQFRLFLFVGNGGDIQWCFSQVKGTVEEDVTEGRGLHIFINLFLVDNEMSRYGGSSFSFAFGNRQLFF